MHYGIMKWMLALFVLIKAWKQSYGHDYCYHYRVLNDRNRAAGVDRGNSLSCDQKDIDSPRWYRFTGAAGYEMPTACVPKHRCGTHAPGWLSTPHPTKPGQIINGKVCFHWSGNCCRWSAFIQIKKCNGFYIYKLGKTPCCYLRYCGNGGFGSDGCTSHMQLNDRTRAAGVHRGNFLTCDQKDLLTPKWYRFTGASGNMMPTSCVPKHYCGTHAPGWLKGSHPTSVGQTVNGKVCFHWGGNCCHWHANVQIKRCNGFYVYKLERTPVCWLRYCGNAGYDICKINNPCKNGATCKLKNDGYTCLCKPGYQGVDCEQDVNECIARPCLNGGTCQNLPGSYKCNCKSGFIGKHCETALDACSHYQALSDRLRAASVQRGNTLKCDQKDLVTPRWYRFTGAAGTMMPTSCVPKHYCGTHAPGWLSGSHPTNVGQVVNGKVCFHWGGSCCHWHANIQIKRCNGFYVYKLARTPVCWLRYCGNAGFDACKANKPCQNGATCTAKNDGYTCLCKPGFQGVNCEQDINECITKPCVNGGTCENLQGSYRCKCKPGFLGKHCETVFDPCIHYEQLNDLQRAASVPRGNTLKCDQKDLATPKWYRFTGAAGTMMPTSCVPKHYCGTHAPGWLSGSHPTSVGQVVNGKVCFHWSGSCCHWNANIQIKKCTNFFVYKLVRTPVCWLRYCGNAGFDPCKASKPCQNGATCVNNNGGYTCLCKPGYQGINCEQDVNECITGPCINGGTCENLPGSYKCKCKQGFLGKHCEIVFDECKHYEVLNDRMRAAGVHRGNTLKCDQKDLETPKWYKFTGAAGSQMPTSCVPKHYCGTHAPGWVSGSHPTSVGQVVNGKVCFHWSGSCCHWHADIQIKKCTGFYVYKLARTPVCWLRYCGNAGFDPCKASKPCENGATCVNNNGDYTCLCKPGYQGRNCEQDVNECITKPCLNGGTCENLQGSYRCKCKQGFLGKHCEIVFDECKHYEVLNDRKRAAGVHRGSTLNCDQEDLVTPKWYRFTGAAGSRMPTSCVPKHYCGTHAPGWVSGLHPTKIGDTVNAKVCFHWASSCCNWNANIQIKRCNGFYVYRLARTPVCWLRYCGNAGFDPCKASKPCQNGATCVSSNDGYTCLCKTGYQGKDCEQDVNECITTPCINGGTCENLQGSYRCKCRPGFLGKHCETVFDECLHYEKLDDRSRAASVQSGNTLKCDQRDLVTPKWYRFTGAAGTMMPTSCVPKHYCGTHAPGWLKGSHPTKVGEIVNGKVCFHWSSNCCLWHANIQIKKCSGFYVYRLARTPVCWLRYCGNAGFDECKINKPCKNGATCVAQQDGYSCICKPGFEGRNCETDANECVTVKPCKNGATCVNTVGGYQCSCPSGFQGKHCDQDINECLTATPCKNGATCVNSVGGYQCLCPPEFTGKNCDQDVNECLIAKPCKNGATCVNTVGGYQCLCSPGFTGKRCDQDVNECLTTKPCTNGATCVNSVGGYQCLCLPGFIGKHCDQDVNECALAKPCKNGATCVNTVGGYQCLCPPEFTGKHCDQDVDECLTTKPCKNGAACVNSVGGFQCLCIPGFTGILCDQDVDECITRPCLNGGTCQNQYGSYSCVCKREYTGKHCETKIDGCTSHTILDDKDRAAGYSGNTDKCDEREIVTPAWYRFSGDAGDKMADACVPTSHCGTHAPGWLKGNLPVNEGEIVQGKVCFHFGSRCCKWTAKIKVKKCKGFFVYELQRPPVCNLRYCGNSGQAVNECVLAKPCKNGATCVDLKNGYNCLCKPGFVGKDCEQDVNECLTVQPCANGATCVNIVGGYQCQCSSGFEGQDCDQDIDECKTSTTCKNGATCVNIVGGYKCDCSSGYKGQHCDQDIDECKAGPCLNGGTCSNKPGSYQCSCVSGFEGKNCENDVDECKNSPCKNGGKCVNLMGSYRCDCNQGFTGKNCEQDVDECKNNPCKNGGKCTNLMGSYRCDCAQGFTGKHCDQDIDECLTNPCLNNGTCYNKPGSYECKCTSGYDSGNCENDIDECSSNNVCKNGGTCINTIGGFRCSCISGFEGIYCDQDIDECKESNPCRNGATCTNLIGGFECKCPSGYHGDTCDQDIDECINNPCKNTGNCSNTIGGYNCQCILGFEGKDCENDVDECKGSNPCKNGGTCENKLGTYKCICPDGVTGFNCEITVSFEELGCFKDKAKDRAMGNMLKSFRKFIDWRDMSKTVKNCSDVARSHKLYYFAVQYYGECYGAQEGTQYDRHGKANNCWSGVGGSYSNFVYRLF